MAILVGLRHALAELGTRGWLEAAQRGKAKALAPVAPPLRAKVVAIVRTKHGKYGGG